MILASAFTIAMMYVLVCSRRIRRERDIAMRVIDFTYDLNRVDIERAYTHANTIAEALAISAELDRMMDARAVTARSFGDRAIAWMPWRSLEKEEARVRASVVAIQYTPPHFAVWGPTCQSTFEH